LNLYLFYLKTGKLKKRFQSTYSNPKGKFNLLHPSYVTGFVDGEGSFSILSLKRAQYKTGWNLIPVFTINLHSRDTALLEKIQSFFGGIGKITIFEKDNSVYFSVKSVKDLINVIIPHFEKYPLLTQKQADFDLFKQIVILMYNKQHLNTKGLNKIISLKASLNKGLTTLLKIHFPNITPIDRPSIQNLCLTNVNPNWITGFVEGEGSFFITTTKSKTYKTGYQIRLDFSIIQHIRDKILMESFVNYFSTGGTYEDKECVKYLASKFLDIQGKIIPFFQKYPLQGYKLSNFDKFCKVAELIEKKAHLTPEGIEKIIKLKKKVK
jgi:LAGLIDADG endonuclease